MHTSNTKNAEKDKNVKEKKIKEQIMIILAAISIFFNSIMFSLKFLPDDEI